MGMILADLVQQQLGDLARFQEQALGLPKAVVIAADANFLVSRICPVIGKVSRLVPNCRFELKTMRTDDILDALHQQTVSLGFIPNVAKAKGLRTKPLFDLRYGVFVPDRLVPRGGTLTAERALRDCPHVLDESDEVLRRGLIVTAETLRVQFKPTMTCSSQVECIAAVRSGFYASVLPLSVSIVDCELRIVDEPVFDMLSYKVAVSWNERHCSVNPHVETIREALSESLQD
jgi:DNA-binding transcriptional LysR family regulator